MDQLYAYIGNAGELISWFGLGLGLPVLFIALSGKAHDGGWDEMQLNVKPGHVPPRITWIRHGRAFERSLDPSEVALLTGESALNAYVSRRNPEIVRLHPYRVGIRAIQVAGMALTVGGAVGLVLSFLPLFAGG